MTRRRFWVCLSASSLAACPNYADVPYCSGHGDCVGVRCECWNGWTGGDCSLRTCPMGAAWADLEGHSEAECSNRGSCDRGSGKCVCDTNFAGAACERLMCQGDGFASCSGRGACLSMYDLARWEYNDKSEQFSYDDVWDAHKIHGCLCGAEYEGPGCARRKCPKGDDPLTSGQSNEIQLVSCAGEGSFKLRFRGFETGEITHTMYAREVEAAIEEAGVDVAASFEGRACFPEDASFEDRTVIEVEFTTLFGTVPDLTVDASSSTTFAGTVQVKTVGADGDGAFLRGRGGYTYAQQCTKEYAECGRRGSCSSEGVCECFSSNFELYGSSNLYGGPGVAGDCGYPLTSITLCPGEEACSNNGVCRGDGVVDDDATPFPSPAAPEAGWQAAKPFYCACHAGWRDGDCGNRICPRGYSWFAYPSADDAAHDGLLECSGIGTCEDGDCACPPPFAGAACEFMDCPNKCSGTGRCLSMRELAVGYDDWDADRIYGCLCDDGYAGHDCSLRTCPVGDNPATRGQTNELQLLKCVATTTTHSSSSSSSSGTLEVSFRDASAASVPFDATARTLETALESLPTVGQIQVTYSYGDALCTTTGEHQNVVHIQFVTEHGDVPDVQVAAAAAADTTAAARVWVRSDGSTLADNVGRTYASLAGTTEAVECSNQGTCDRTTGLCSCFSGFLGTSSDVVTRLSRQRQTGVSLRGLLAAGREHLRQLPEVSPTPMLLTVAAFLHRELPIRLARRVAELDRLPSLYAMPSVKLVREWYAQSAIEIFESERPVDPLSEERFARLIDAIYERHAAVLITMAKGAHELRSSMKERFAFELDLQIHQFLDSFYTSRIGIRVIIGQYLALRQCTPQSTRIGLLDTQVVPAQVAVDAVDQATMLCERQFGVAPEVELHGRLDLAFSYVPDHLYYIMLELLKNSMRATVEQHAKLVGEVDHKTLAPVKVVVADGEENEDVALKVSDEGGGIARSHMPRVWSYLFTTASHEVQERGFLDTNSRSSDFGGAPLAGLGYGLPISRAYARYFGGDVTLMSMEGYGTDAYVYLSRLGDHDEPLP